MMPDSQVHIDGHKQALCALKKLCMICGKKLLPKKWFIGGQHAAMNRLFTDPAMHEECARYALKVCPFLSNPDMKYRKKYSEETFLYTTPIPGTTIERSDTQLLMRTNGYRTVWWRGHAYVLANRWDYIEHWIAGEQVADPEERSIKDPWLMGGMFDVGGSLEHEVATIKE
jgi:hypothetical protein